MDQFLNEERELAESLPTNKSALLSLVRAGRMRQVHAQKYSPAHNATNYDRWYRVAVDSEPFQVRYEHEYEPYLVARIADLPPWDERFVGYGYDKVVHVLTLALEQTELRVLPGLFATHVDHGVPRWRRTGALLRIRVFQNFHTVLQELLHDYTDASEFFKQLW